LLPGLIFVDGDSPDGTSDIVRRIAHELPEFDHFVLNNTFTYRDARLAGWPWIGGWMAFILACVWNSRQGGDCSLSLREQCGMDARGFE
jgi:glycosyltransferase involved in cell wall biosynthesis